MEVEKSVKPATCSKSIAGEEICTWQCFPATSVSDFLSEQEEVEWVLTKDQRKRHKRFFLLERNELHVTHHYMLKGGLNKGQAYKTT